MYAIITKPIYSLNIVFEWKEERDKFFEKPKQALILAPMLRAPNYRWIFHVHVDAFAYALGCVLAQLGKNNMDFPIYYASK